MSDEAQYDASETPIAASGPDSESPARSLFASPFARLGGWAAEHWSRRLIAAAVVILLFAATIATWFYLARLALRADQATLETTLATLDGANYEAARTLASGMLDSGLLRRGELGGPLFVLGAVKVNEAESQATPAKRRTDYLIASRYLKESRHFGFPTGREADGLLLLGESLIESNQFQEGIIVLEELLARPLPAESPLVWQVHRLIAETCFAMPSPELEKSSHHFAAVLAHSALPAEARNSALLLQATADARLGRYDEARRALNQIPDGAVEECRLTLVDAEITLDEMVAEKERRNPEELAQVMASQRPKIKAALRSLEQIQTQPNGGDVQRRAAYLQGRGYVILGQHNDALRQFSRTRQLYADAPEAIAAALAEAKLLREQRDDASALAGYRRVLDSIPSSSSYRSDVLPLSHVRQQMLAALADLVEREKFDETMTLVASLSPIFSRAEQLALRAQTFERWGNLQLTRADDNSADSVSLRAAGLRHLREAGIAYEQLADSRFATPFYTDDLWKSAEAFFRGHSFSEAVRVLNVYLDNELELRNAQALLRVGQASLAMGKPTQSIAAFEECIEFHPLDPSTYQARIDCAKAYWNEGELDIAERLLRDNIAGTSLKPSSREWRDSLFVLGTLLHEKGEYEESIDALEEAIQRYPDDAQRLIAQYVIGESYRHWAAEPLAAQQQARTDNERDKSVQLAQERLTAALRSFEEVQRSITLRAHDIHEDPLIATMLRNCYMIEATVLFDLNRYDEAIKAYSNVSALYPNEPFVLETFVQIANCWHRLNRSDKAHGAIHQAQIALDRMPGDANFASATSFSREEWRLLLNDMSRW